MARSADNELEKAFVEEFEQSESAQNHWISGICPSFGILNTRKHKVPETYFRLQLRSVTLSLVSRK
jgi:hypothetical protein